MTASAPVRPGLPGRVSSRLSQVAVYSAVHIVGLVREGLVGDACWKSFINNCYC